MAFLIGLGFVPCYLIWAFIVFWYRSHFLIWVFLLVLLFRSSFLDSFVLGAMRKREREPLQGLLDSEGAWPFHKREKVPVVMIGGEWVLSLIWRRGLWHLRSPDSSFVKENFLASWEWRTGAFFFHRKSFLSFSIFFIFYFYFRIYFNAFNYMVYVASFHLTN